MAVQAQFPLCGSQDWMDNGWGGGFTGFGYSYLQQHHHHQHQEFDTPPFQNQNICLNTTSIYDSFSSIPHAQSMAAYEEKQKQEVDHYIRSQNERLRLLMQEQRKQHIASLMKKIESKALPLLRNKDEEIAQAVKRRVALEEFLKRLEMENQAWKRVAQESEAMVNSLNNTIEQIRERVSCCFDNGAESCFEIGNRQVEQEEEKMMSICKGCNSRNSCVLFLPCRHLCSCKACEAFLDSCPVCLTEKKATIEALIL